MIAVCNPDSLRKVVTITPEGNVASFILDNAFTNVVDMASKYVPYNIPFWVLPFNADDPTYADLDYSAAFYGLGSLRWSLEVIRKRLIEITDPEIRLQYLGMASDIIDQIVDENTLNSNI